jgi:subtilisin
MPMSALPKAAEALVGILSAVPRVRGGGRQLSEAVTAGVAAGIVHVAEPQTRRCVVLPPRGLRLRSGAGEGPLRATLLALSNQVKAGAVALSNVGVGTLGLDVTTATTTTLRVIDSIGEDGAKLIEYHPGEEGALRAALSGLRFVPEVFYEPMSLRLSLESNLEPSGGGSNLQVTVRSRGTGKPMSSVKVVGFTDFASRTGAQAVTNAKGVATLQFVAKPSILERLYAFADRAFWSALHKNASTANPLVLELAAIDLAPVHALRNYYGEPDLTAGAGVKVGVLDTGCGPHHDLQIAGGFNAVGGQDPTEFDDNGDLHGTHVAGIIAARGSAPTGIRGVAPGVTLFSYRVFARGSNASNFDIARAIDKAQEDGCDLINLSLGRPAGGVSPGEEAVRIALEEAREAGMLPIAAAGNDFRRGVSFPGADDLCIAVSALGNKGLLAERSASAGAEAPPPGRNAAEFIGEFSNVGVEVDLTGPGVGVISTVPQDGFAVMDGTSMACPAVTGVAARLLASRPDILGMSRDAARAKAVAALLLETAKTRGFTPLLEGRGLPA